MERFVVKAHWASQLHYDLRLEMDGVAKSWAIPKEPPIEAGLRRLAIQVGDHSIKDLDVEDLSKEERPRSGRVETWDDGLYEILERSEEKYFLHFYGGKLRGLYGLFKMKWEENTWLITKATLEEEDAIDSTRRYKQG